MSESAMNPIMSLLQKDTYPKSIQSLQAFMLHI